MDVLSFWQGAIIEIFQIFNWLSWILPNGLSGPRHRDGFILISEGWSRPTGGGTHKKGHDVCRVLFCGKALQSRYFKFLIRHLDILPNGPSGPRRFCGVRAFCRRQNLGGGMALPSRAFESPKGGAGSGPAKPKKKDTL